MTYLSRAKFLVLLIAVVFLAGCASTQNQNQSDPLESMNRAVFDFNETLDDYVMEPAARGYKWVMPDPLELLISNFFSNLNDVVVTTNSILQLNYESALASGTRVLINTTFGMFGLIDIASDITAASDVNLSKRNEDFGQTLGFYGLGTGPYIVLPLLGPSTARDAFGFAIDSVFIDPVTQGVTSVFVDGVPYLNASEVRLPVATGRALDERAKLFDVEKTLEEAALDKYEFVRDAYFQRRESLINNEDTNEPNGKD